jgi:hypothetical protein
MLLERMQIASGMKVNENPYIERALILVHIMSQIGATSGSPEAQ